jgi:CheY-like chemotaxis protein
MSPRILIVEDDPIAQNLLAAILTGAGYATDAAADGFAALRLLRQNVYRIAFIDFHLPAMDGYALGKLMRDGAWGGDPRLRLVIVTADHQGLAARPEVGALFDAILLKPFAPSAPIGLVETVGCPSTEARDASAACDAAAAFMADPSADRARAAAASFWRSRGLTGLPKAHVLPAPTADQAADIGLCFDLVGREEAELVLLAGPNGAAALSDLRGRHGLTAPVAALDDSLIGLADVFFRVNDPHSWTALARCLRGVDKRRIASSV